MSFPDRYSTCCFAVQIGFRLGNVLEPFHTEPHTLERRDSALKFTGLVHVSKGLLHLDVARISQCGFRVRAIHEDRLHTLTGGDRDLLGLRIQRIPLGGFLRFLHPIRAGLHLRTTGRIAVLVGDECRDTLGERLIRIHRVFGAGHVIRIVVGRVIRVRTRLLERHLTFLHELGRIQHALQWLPVRRSVIVGGVIVLVRRIGCLVGQIPSQADHRIRLEIRLSAA